jgi:hypothetical protein
MEIRDNGLHNQLEKYEMYAQDATTILALELCKTWQIQESASPV